jgi:D-2-hydroxyacid dehydrogenase (NADP+)
MTVPVMEPLKTTVMKNNSKYTSRRDFLKGVMINGAALTAIPAGVLGSGAISGGLTGKDRIPRLPLRIMIRAGLSDAFREKLLSISPRIQLEDDDQAIEEIHAWFGGINREQFLKASSLQWVQSPSAGVEHYLFPEFVRSGVLLTNAKGCYGPAISEHTLGLLFTLTRNLGSQNRNMSRGMWQRDTDNMVEMKGMTMGVVGLGGIGSQVARRARAMDMKVIAVDIMPKYKEQIGDICDEVRLVQDGGLDWLLARADVIVSAAPHTKVSEGMFGARQFGRMKQGAYFINVSRGKLVKTPDLVEVLKSGHLAGAGLDVTDPEPLPPDHILWTLPNVIITAHISGASQHSSHRMQEVFTENVSRYVKGLPLLNQVDKEMGF